MNWNLVPGVSCSDVALKHGITAKAFEVWAQVEKRGPRITNSKLMVTYWLRAVKMAFALRQEDAVMQERKTTKGQNKVPAAALKITPL